VFLGWWLLRESVDAYVLGGMAIILLAVVLVTGARVGAAPANKTAPPVRATLKPVEELAN